MGFLVVVFVVDVLMNDRIRSGRSFRARRKQPHNGHVGANAASRCRHAADHVLLFHGEFLLWATAGYRDNSSVDTTECTHRRWLTGGQKAVARAPGWGYKAPGIATLLPGWHTARLPSRLTCFPTHRLCVYLTERPRGGNPRGRVGLRKISRYPRSARIIGVQRESVQPHKAVADVDWVLPFD